MHALYLYPSLKSQLHTECKTSSSCYFADDEDGALIIHLSAPVSRILNGSNPYFLNLELRVMAR